MPTYASNTNQQHPHVAVKPSAINNSLAVLKLLRGQQIAVSSKTLCCFILLHIECKLLSK